MSDTTLSPDEPQRAFGDALPAPTLPPDLVTDAVQAFERYRFALANGLLIQIAWHEERDGRQLACALGVLGATVESPDDCPAAVMPRWLARMTPSMFDALAPDDALAWGLALYAQLARLRGEVPFSVVDDWQCNGVLPFWSASLSKRRFDPETMATKLAEVERLRTLHLKHLAGGAAPKAEWHEALRPVYADVCGDAYDSAYAEVEVYAVRDSGVYGDDCAYAYAFAYAYACADASTEPAAVADKSLGYRRRYAENMKHLAGELVAALARVPAPQAVPA